MKELTALPNEILRNICDILHPADIVNFALCSKSIHELSKPRLNEHQTFQDKYQVILNWRTEHYLYRLPQVLTDILANPRISYYIRSLRFGLFATGWTTGSTQLYHAYFKQTDYPPHDPGEVDRFCDLGRASGLDSLTERADYFEDFDEEEPPYFPEPLSPRSITAQWHQRLKEGCEGIIAALLVSQLTDLERLEWIPIDGDVNFDTCWFFHNMCKKMSRLPGIDPFCNLKTVALRRNEVATSHVDTHERSLRFFMELPSVRTIHAQMVDDAALRYELLHAKTSNVTRLSLFQGFLHDSSVEQLIGCTRALKVFTFRWPVTRPEAPGTIPVTQIQQSLKMHHRGTLQELIFRSAGLKGQINPGQWSQFPNLRYLTVNLSLLFPRDKSEILPCYFPDLNDAILIAAYRQTLPLSMEHLQLYETKRSNGLLSYLKDVQWLMRYKNLIVPHLRRLDLHLIARVNLGNDDREYLTNFAEQWALYDQLPQSITPAPNPTSSTESMQTPDVENDIEVLEREIPPSRFVHPTFPAPEIQASISNLVDECQIQTVDLHIWHRLSRWQEDIKEFGRLEDDGFEVDA